MNIRKRFLRLTLVLSILLGIASSIWMLEHTIENEHGIVRRCLPYGLQISVNNEWKARAIESIAKKKYPYDFVLLRKLHSETHESFGPDYILFWWRHLAVLSLPGFVIVWVIYGLTGWVIIPFIGGGFKDNSARRGETE